MGGDIREANKIPIQQNSTSTAVPPSNVNSYETFNGPSNSYTLSSKPTLAEAVKTVRVEDFKQIHKYPCTRDAFLTGMGGGFGIGGIRLVFGAPVLKACSWAVGVFCFTSIASYEYCLYKRRTEKRNLKRVVEVLDQRRTEKGTEQAHMKAEMDEREGGKLEAAKQTQEPKRSSWRFW